MAQALHSTGYLKRLVEADLFQPVAKGIVLAAAGKVQEHWTARHSVHVWDRLELSRSQMETLRHLLSYPAPPPLPEWRYTGMDVRPRSLLATIPPQHARVQHLGLGLALTLTLILTRCARAACSRPYRPRAGASTRASRSTAAHARHRRRPRPSFSFMFLM